jgi:vacuolar-type H+-ATPase subunit F/Vma7
LAGYLSQLNPGAKSIGVPFRMGECNSYYNGGAAGVSNAYASALWVLDFLFNCAQGGAAGVNFHGGSSNCYTPIADKSGAVVEARPVFYGMTLFALAGQGVVYQTNLSAGGINATAYAVKDSSGNVNIVVVNKDATENLSLKISMPRSVSSASLMTMTQLSSGAEGPSVSATSGVTIQGATIDADGDFSPSSAYSLSTSGSEISCYVPALSAVLIKTK